MMYRLLRISVPAAVDSLSVIAGQFWFLSLVNKIGDESTRNFNIAAHGHAIRWEAAFYLSAHAFGTAAMALVGQNLERENAPPTRPRAAGRRDWRCGRLSDGLDLLYLGGADVSPVRAGDHQKPVIEVGVPVLRLVAFAMPALAARQSSRRRCEGAGDTRRPVLLPGSGFCAYASR